MAAAHDWDIAVAQQVGCTTAFVARPGMVYSSLFEEPDITGEDLETVVV